MFLLAHLPLLASSVSRHYNAFTLLLTALTLLSLALVKVVEITALAHEASLGSFPAEERVVPRRLRTHRVGEGPLHQRVCIAGTERERDLIDIISYNLARSKHRSRSYDIFLGNGKDKETLFIPREREYFLVLHLRKDKEAFFVQRPLLSINPNSDLVAVLLHFFDSELAFSARDVLPNKNPNTVTLHLSQHSVGTFLSFLRAVHNLQSHSLGEYFYTPTGTSFVPLYSLIPFLLLSFLLSLFFPSLLLPLALSPLNHKLSTLLLLASLLLLFYQRLRVTCNIQYALAHHK